MEKTWRRQSVFVNDLGHVIGQDHHRAKLTDHEVWLIQELRASGMKLRTIAKKFEISLSTAHGICSGRLRCHLPVGQITRR